MSVSRQGKCTQCDIRWVWRGGVTVRDARCPNCGSQIQRTSKNVNLPTFEAVVRFHHNGDSGYVQIVAPIDAVYRSKMRALRRGAGTHGR